MSTTTYDAVVAVLRSQIRGIQPQVQPQTELHKLGLDSLELMEFVFAVEDHFDLRIPEDRLDPRQAQLTLADICLAIDVAIEQRGKTVSAA